MNFKSILSKLKSKQASTSKKLTISQATASWLIIVVILLADIWVLQGSVRVLYKVQFQDVGAREVEPTRVNFSALKQSIERIDRAEGYAPAPGPATNPFKEVPKNIPPTN